MFVEKLVGRVSGRESDTPKILKVAGRLKGGVFLNIIILLHKTIFFFKLGGCLKGGVVLKVGFYSTW